MTTATTTRTAKSNRFIYAKQQLCTCITIFCTFLSRRCTTATWNVLILHVSRALWSRWTQHKTFLFLFIHLNTVLSDFTPEYFTTFDKWNKIEWDWWSVKQCKFTVTVSVCCHQEILLPWQCDVTTSLYYGHFRLSLGNSNLFPWSLVNQIDASNPGLHVHIGVVIRQMMS